MIAAGHVFDTGMPDGAWLAPGPEVAPGGYAYLLVHVGRGTVASCRYAIRSGVLAARCLLEGADYTARWQAEFGSSLKAGIANRRLFNTAGRPGMTLAVSRLAARDAGDLLRRAYALTPLKRLVLPVARRRYRAMLADPGCSHENCDCVWCRHGDHAATAARPAAPI